MPRYRRGFDIDEAQAHLQRVDKRLASWMRRIGPLPPPQGWARSFDPVDALARAILFQQLSGKAALYVCGPHGMLAAVARIADARQLPCQVSLENYMACGVGACLGCVTPGKNHSPTTPDYRCVCAEGPVFASNELQWRS